MRRRQRLRQGAKRWGVSDGRLEIFDEFPHHWQPVEELTEAELMIVDTSKPRAYNLEVPLRRFGAWPPR